MSAYLGKATFQLLDLLLTTCNVHLCALPLVIDGLKLSAMLSAQKRFRRDSEPVLYSHWTKEERSLHSSQSGFSETK